MWRQCCPERVPATVPTIRHQSRDWQTYFQAQYPQPPGQGPTGNVRRSVRVGGNVRPRGSRSDSRSHPRGRVRPATSDTTLGPPATSDVGSVGRLNVRQGYYGPHNKQAAVYESGLDNSPMYTPGGGARQGVLQYHDSTTSGQRSGVAGFAVWSLVHCF